MKTTKIVGLLILTLIISSFNISENKDYFEGKVTFQLSYKPIHKNATIEFLESNYGVTEIMYYKNGFYKKISLNKNGDTLKTIIHNPISKQIYAKHISFGDTIITYSSLDNVMKSYKESKITDEKILGYDAYGIQLDFKILDDFTLDGIEDQVIINYFSKKFKINPENHKYQKDGFFNEIVLKHPYITLKSIIDDKFIKVQTKTAIEIKEMEIDNSIFEIDLSNPLKQI